MLHKVELLRAACCMAGLDGTIGDAELAIIQKLATDAGVGAASLKAMMDRAKSDPSYYEQQFRFLRGDANDDGRVNLLDFDIVAANFAQTGKFFSDGDFTYDRIVNLLDFDVLAAGHGTGLFRKADVAMTREFFEDLIAAVTVGMQQGRSLEEMERTILLEKYKDWAQYDRLRVYNIRSAYQNLKTYR